MGKVDISPIQQTYLPSLSHQWQQDKLPLIIKNNISHREQRNIFWVRSSVAWFLHYYSLVNSQFSSQSIASRSCVS